MLDVLSTIVTLPASSTLDGWSKFFLVLMYMLVRKMTTCRLEMLMLMLMLILMLMLMLIFTLRLKILSAETAMPKADKRTRWSLWKVIDIFDETKLVEMITVIKTVIYNKV